MDTPPIFQNRRAAGRRLAGRLQGYRELDPIILALPRGGVPVAFEISLALGAPLDVIVARKIGAPSQPELGVGAIAPGGVLLLDFDMMRSAGVTSDELSGVIERERAEMSRRLAEYRGSADVPDVRGRTVIIVDDGLATGVTAAAAIASVRRSDPARVVLAVPVCARRTAESMASEVDALVCAAMPEHFQAVGAWYVEFGQTSDAEVIELLEEADEHAEAESLREIW